MPSSANTMGNRPPDQVRNPTRDLLDSCCRHRLPLARGAGGQRGDGNPEGGAAPAGRPPRAPGAAAVRHHPARPHGLHWVRPKNLREDKKAEKPPPLQPPPPKSNTVPMRLPSRLPFYALPLSLPLPPSLLLLGNLWRICAEHCSTMMSPTQGTLRPEFRVHPAKLISDRPSNSLAQPYRKCLTELLETAKVLTGNVAAAPWREFRGGVPVVLSRDYMTAAVRASRCLALLCDLVASCQACS